MEVISESSPEAENGCTDLRQVPSSEQLCSAASMQAMHRAMSYRLFPMSKMKIQTRGPSKISRRRTQRPASVQLSDSEDESSMSQTTAADNIDYFEENYDFDADDDIPLEQTPSHHHVSQATYRDACASFNVIPANYFMRHLPTTEIVMKNHMLGPMGAKACAIALLTNNTVRTLNLEDNDITSVGAAYFADMLRENTFLTSVTLSENKLGSEGARLMAEMLKLNESIKKLDLSGNGFKEEDADYFGEILMENQTIRELRISHNCFRENGGIVLGKAIAHNVTVEVLDLSWNHLRRKGAVAICEGLKKNIGLLHLNVAWNGFFLDGCKAMAKSLTTNNTLKQLDMSCNRMDITCLAELLKGVKKNTTLESLKVGYNPLSTEGAMTILHLVDQCPDIAINELDISGQCVEVDFINLMNQIQSKRCLRVKYGLILRQDEMFSEEGEEFINDDPMMVLMECMRLRNLRLVDLFTALDKDGSNTLTRDEFKNGLLGVNIPLSENCLDRLVDKLDVDGDGEVDFSELINGQRDHRRKMSKMMQTSKEHSIPIEETELGRISAKLQSLMKARRRINSMGEMIQMTQGGLAGFLSGVTEKKMKDEKLNAKDKKPAKKSAKKRTKTR